MVDQLTNAQLLVKYGFIKGKAKSKYKLDKEKGYYVNSEGKEEYDDKDADEEYDEEGHIFWNKEYQPTGYPSTPLRTRLVHEGFNMSLEELYYWCLNFVKQDMGFPYVEKVTDVMTNSEQSAMFGQSAQRLSIQEDRASGFLRGISEMVKTLFQIVRELRIIDERLDIYQKWKENKSADVTLKGLYADFAENKGGQMQPGSIYHLSDQVGYAVLPDLFFNTRVYKKENINKIVDEMPGYNSNVKNVLKRKLYHFIVWKERTEKEMVSRRTFQIKYLRQHYLTIKMYMSWVKPYLKHIKRMTASEKDLDSPELVGAFETSANEVELIAYKKNPGNACNSVILMNFKFNTRPVMQYRQEFHQGPVHIGRGKMTLRIYPWTDEQIKMYKKMRDYEDRELLMLVDDKLKSAMDLLGEDLDRYLKEAEGVNEKKEEEKKKKSAKDYLLSEDSLFDPFVSLFKGFAEIGGLVVPGKLFQKKKSGPKKNEKAAIKGAQLPMWLTYNTYKKSHRLLSW